MQSYCEGYPKSQIKNKRDRLRQTIRRQHIDSIFMEKRSLLVKQNRSCNIQNQQNNQISLNLFSPPVPNSACFQQMAPLNLFFYQNQPNPVQHNFPPSNQPNLNYLKPLTFESPKVKTSNHIHRQVSSNILTQNSEFRVFRKVIGEGSYSKIYQGIQKNSNMKVAVKQIKELQQNELMCLKSTGCQYIVKMYDFWRQGRKTYLVLELCDKNLRQEMKRCTREQSIKYFIQVLEGMCYLVKKKIIHRDLKFENILIKDKTVKITDFGLAKNLGNNLSVESLRCGTPYTMAPQILFHSGHSKPIYTSKCDIWSLGVLLHEIIYQKHPFDYSQERMVKKKRVSVNKEFSIYDSFIDRALIFDQRSRMDWQQVQLILNHLKNPQSIERTPVQNNLRQDFRLQNIQPQSPPDYNNAFKKKKNLKKPILQQRNQNIRQYVDYRNPSPIPIRRQYQQLEEIEQERLEYQKMKLNVKKATNYKIPKPRILEDRKPLPKQVSNMVKKQKNFKPDSHSIFKSPRQTEHVTSCSSFSSTQQENRQFARSSSISFKLKSQKKQPENLIRTVIKDGLILVGGLVAMYYFLL